jgi:hypothetical protein
MTGSDQITKLKDRNEQLQKQLDGSRKRVSDLEAQLKRTRSPPPLPKDGTGPDEDPGELEKKLQELTEKLAKQNQEFERSRGELQKELAVARAERDEFAEQLRTLREKPARTASSPSGGKGREEPKYDPETQKYKFSWVGDSRKDGGDKGPPAAKQQGSAELDRRATEEKMAAMAIKKQVSEQGKPAQKVEKKAEPKGEQKEDEEELEETASYSVEELLEKVDSEDLDVAVVTSESGGRPVLRMHAVPDDELAEPTFQESEESLVAGSREEEVTDKRTDDDSDVITVEKMLEEVSPAVFKPLFARLTKALFDHRALILKSLFFLVGAGLGVGLALLIFIGSDTKEPGLEEGAGVAEEVVKAPAEAPEKEKTGKTDAVKPDKEDVTADTARPKADRAPVELVEPIYQAAAIMDKQAAVKIGATLGAFVGKYPKDPLLRYHYARALYLKGDVYAAVVQLEESRKLNPDLPEVHYMLGSIYLQTGDEKKAHEAMNNFARLTGKTNK